MSLFRNKPKELTITTFILGLASFSLVVSLILLILLTARINQTDIPPQEGQLLNRTSIEKAAELMREQTVVFNETRESDEIN